LLLINNLNYIKMFCIPFVCKKRLY
jgi:hypothetical protein